MVTRSGTSFAGATPTKPNTSTPKKQKTPAQGPEDPQEKHLALFRLFNDVEKAGTPSSPVKIFNSDMDYYGEPNTPKRNWFSNQFFNYAKKAEHIMKYNFLLKKLNIQPSQATKDRLAAANSTNVESRTPSDKRVPADDYCEREDESKDDDMADWLSKMDLNDDDKEESMMTQLATKKFSDPNSFKVVNKMNGFAFDNSSSTAMEESALVFNTLEYYDGSSSSRPLPVFIQKGQTCCGAHPFKTVWNSMIKKNGMTLQGYTIWFSGDREHIWGCIQEIPDDIPMAFLPYKDSIVLVIVPTFSRAYKNMIDNVIKKSVTFEQDPESYEKLQATNLRVEEDSGLKWSYYYLLFPMNQKLDNRILSEKDNEGKHLDLEVLPNGYHDEEEDIFFFSGVCKSRIAVSDGATRYQNTRKTTATGSFATLLSKS